MNDLFGHWVPKERINAVLSVMRQAHWHVFQTLTKYPIRMRDFDLPPNLWAGFSMPADFMHGHELTEVSKRAWLARALKITAETNATVKWISFEPLSWDVVPVLEQYVADNPWHIAWAVIGAGSDGRKKHAPKQAHFEKLVAFLDKHDTPVFYKGNLKEAPYLTDWRQEWPK